MMPLSLKDTGGYRKNLRVDAWTVVLAVQTLPFKVCNKFDVD